MIFGTQGGVRSENSEKLEFDYLLNENARFLRAQGLQNEAKMVPKRVEKRKKSREEGKREQRSAKRVLESVLGALWGDILRFRGGAVEFAAGLAYLARPCISEGLGPKSEQKCCKVAQIRDVAISWILASQ